MTVIEIEPVKTIVESLKAHPTDTSWFTVFSQMKPVRSFIFVPYMPGDDFYSIIRLGSFKAV